MVLGQSFHPQELATSGRAESLKLEWPIEDSRFWKTLFLYQVEAVETEPGFNVWVPRELEGLPPGPADLANLSCLFMMLSTCPCSARRSISPKQYIVAHLARYTRLHETIDWSGDYIACKKKHGSSVCSSLLSIRCSEDPRSLLLRAASTFRDHSESPEKNPSASDDDDAVSVSHRNRRALPPASGREARRGVDNAISVERRRVRTQAVCGGKRMKRQVKWDESVMSVFSKHVCAYETTDGLFQNDMDSTLWHFHIQIDSTRFKTRKMCKHSMYGVYINAVCLHYSRQVQSIETSNRALHGPSQHSISENFAPVGCSLLACLL